MILPGSFGIRSAPSVALCRAGSGSRALWTFAVGRTPAVNERFSLSARAPAPVRCRAAAKLAALLNWLSGKRSQLARTEASQG